jgi:hypothetical protein
MNLSSHVSSSHASILLLTCILACMNLSSPAPVSLHSSSSNRILCIVSSTTFATTQSSQRHTIMQYSASCKKPRARCTCTHARTHARTHTRTHARTHARTGARTPASALGSAQNNCCPCRALLFVCVRARRIAARAHTHTLTRERAHTPSCRRPRARCMCTHALTHAYTHTHTHTHTRISARAYTPRSRTRTCTLTQHLAGALSKAISGAWEAMTPGDDLQEDIDADQGAREAEGAVGGADHH